MFHHSGTDGRDVGVGVRVECWVILRRLADEGPLARKTMTVRKTKIINAWLCLSINFDTIFLKEQLQISITQGIRKS